ncbi:MAG: carboxypeptidase regulatory-like domain-containing protein [Candidatus Poribacteria bacterium]|nr:carboxypeptidase regulatory-like domain-containing protein [Candidatus Poribacteria bacterium]
MKVCLLLILFLLVIAPLPLLAQTGNVEGTIYQRSTGKPLEGADVHILETDQHQKTDANGNFQFTGIPIGTYTLSVSHPNFKTPEKTTIEISAGKTIQGKIYLGPAFQVEKATATGNIEGTVYDRDTGALLAGAEVYIVEIEKRQYTKRDGKFRFTDIPPGTYNISIKHLAFDTPTLTTVEISAGGTTQIRIYLGPVFKLETVIVEGKRLPPTISRQEIRGSEIRRIAGIGADPLKALTTLPSIGIPNDFFGILYIRGSEPGSTLYYFDRTPLGYPFHFGGVVSTIFSGAIDNIHIYAGGYGAEFGLDSQSVIDIYSPDWIQKKRAGVINMNPFYPQAYIQTRIGKKGYVSAAARRALLGLFLNSIYNSTFPNLADYQFKFVYLLTDKHQLMLNAFGATDHFDFSNSILYSIEADNNLSAYYKNGFEGAGIHLKSEFTEKFISHLSLTRSFNFLNIQFGTPFNIDEGPSREGTFDDIKTKVPAYQLRTDIAYKITDKFQFEPGFLLSYSPADSFSYNTRAFVDEDSDEGELVGSRSVDEFSYPFRRAEGYLQGRYDPFSFLSLALGVRYDYLNMTDELSTQPRASMNVKLPIGTNVRLAYGQYEQSPLAYQVLRDGGNRSLKSSEAQHYIMELEHNFSPHTEFKFATYYKDLQKLVSRYIDLEALTESLADATVDIPFTNYLNEGAGFVSGVEAFLRHRIKDRFFGWISYAYTHSERRNHPNDAYRPYLFDNSHIVSVVANYNLSQKYELGMKWQFLSGTSAAPISALFQIQDPITLGMNKIISDNLDALLETELPPYHRLDLRLSWKGRRFGLPVTEFIEIWNAYFFLHRNSMRLGVSKQVLDVVIKNIAPEDLPEDFDRSTLENIKAPQIPFAISGGIVYEF